MLWIRAIAIQTLDSENMKSPNTQAAAVGEAVRQKRLAEQAPGRGSGSRRWAWIWRGRVQLRLIGPNQAHVGSPRRRVSSVTAAVDRRRRETADRLGRSVATLLTAIFQANPLMRRQKYDYGAFGAKSSDNYATRSGKRCPNPILWRKFIVSKFREAMVSQVSGSSRSRRIEGICRGKATIERSKREEGADRLQFQRSVGGPGSRRREENQRPPRLTGGHK